MGIMVTPMQTHRTNPEVAQQGNDQADCQEAEDSQDENASVMEHLSLMHMTLDRVKILNTFIEIIYFCQFYLEVSSYCKVIVRAYQSVV